MTRSLILNRGFGEAIDALRALRREKEASAGTSEKRRRSLSARHMRSMSRDSQRQYSPGAPAAAKCRLRTQA